jgi:ribosome-associated protein
MQEPLRVGDDLVIPAAELRWRFDPSGGPGGQHANRSSTRVELSFDLRASSAPTEELRARMLRRLGERAPGGVVTVTVDESRSQWRNRVIARRRLGKLLADAGRRERRPRIPTRPTREARRRRLERKRRRGELKRLRRRPESE